MRISHCYSHTNLIHSDSFLNIMETSHHCLKIHVDGVSNSRWSVAENYDALASRRNDVWLWPLHLLVNESSLILVISKA
jgi:hypothetical protein